jgi:hypothetical protein
MGRCRYCQHSAGWFKQEHPECLEKHQLGLDKIQTVFSDYLRNGASSTHADQGSTRSAEQIKTSVEATAKESFITSTELRRLMVSGLRTVVDVALENELSEERESRVSQLQKALGLEQSEVGEAAVRLVKAATLRDVSKGMIRSHIDVPETPLVLRNNETILWLTNNVELHEIKTRTQYVGGGQGLSFRVARGVYYRVGGGRGQPIQSQSVEMQDRGSLIVTNQNIYFCGPLKSLRLPIKKLVTVQGYSDGISVVRESANPRPIVFKLDDPWFVGNLILKLGALPEP